MPTMIGEKDVNLRHRQVTPRWRNWCRAGQLMRNWGKDRLTIPDLVEFP